MRQPVEHRAPACPGASSSLGAARLQVDGRYPVQRARLATSADWHPHDAVGDMQAGQVGLLWDTEDGPPTKKLDTGPARLYQPMLCRRIQPRNGKRRTK